ncbi:MAG: Uncharacterized protein Athens101428_815, partial [Candidatus Berkelbacteria bacterium Athens1014_28]
MTEETEKPAENEPEKEERIVLPAKKKRNLLWLWILIALIIGGSAVGAYAYRGEIKKLIFGEKKSEEAASEKKSSESEEAPVSTKVVDDGIIWLNPRVKLDDLGLFKKVADPNFPEGYQGTTYYKVATTSDSGEIILALVKIETMGYYYDLHHFLKKDGKYWWLSQNSDAIGSDDINCYAKTSSNVDNTFTIKSLQLDKTITEGSTKLTQDANSSRITTFADKESTGKKIDETKWGDLYLLEGDAIELSTGQAKVAQYYVLRNDGVKIIYWPTPTFRKDDGSLTVTWSNPIGAAATFSQIKTSGCGGGGGSFPLITKASSLATKKEVGKASFAENLGVIVWQDDYENWTIFMNDKYAPQAECGKPVIYLYPEKEMNVRVLVGADITKSEPVYNKGWNVFASPSGSLKIAGKTFPYLFWEGTGWGKYPA